MSRELFLNRKGDTMEHDEICLLDMLSLLRGNSNRKINEARKRSALAGEADCREAAPFCFACRKEDIS